MIPWTWLLTPAGGNIIPSLTLLASRLENLRHRFRVVRFRGSRADSVCRVRTRSVADKDLRSNALLPPVKHVASRCSPFLFHYGFKLLEFGNAIFILIVIVIHIHIQGFWDTTTSVVHILGFWGTTTGVVTILDIWGTTTSIAVGFDRFNNPGAELPLDQQ
ncbi:hypothetical protein IFM51744_10867 [Aspergillus udagawae]|nr:hypothetical protein IFM51744_10867 [Aspergillus udagawae]